jgi:hypothetical protein
MAGFRRAAKIEEVVVMNNSELDSLLRKARVPERSAEFWEEFPRRIRNRLGSARASDNRHSSGRVSLRWAWALGAAACVLAGVFIGSWLERPKAEDILRDAKVVDETLAMFPHSVRAIVEDEHGLHLVLSQDASIPASAPLYIHVCDGRHCSSVVTFSGQEVQLAGRKVTVLADTHGGIILEGNQLLWSSREAIDGNAHLKIEAKNLGSATM